MEEEREQLKVRLTRKVSMEAMEKNWDLTFFQEGAIMRETIFCFLSWKGAKNILRIEKDRE